MIKTTIQHDCAERLDEEGCSVGTPPSLGYAARGIGATITDALLAAPCKAVAERCA